MRSILIAGSTIGLFCFALSPLSAQTGGRGGPKIQDVAPRYPLDPERNGFAPFTDDSGAPVIASAVAAGQADLDGDRNQDLWFLGDAAQARNLGIQFATASGLGRFYRREALGPSSFTAAATYRTSTSIVDSIVAVDPALDQPMLLSWIAPTKGDPRDGHLGGTVSGWTTGKGVTEIATADHSGDTHDDIVVLQALPGDRTMIRKLVMGTSKNFLWVESEVKVEIPVRLRHLELLDLDADGLTDVVACAPGLGVLSCRDDGKGRFELSGFWPTGDLGIVDLTTGDLDGNGREDIAIIYSTGVVLIAHHAPGPLWPSGIGYRLFRNPAGVGSLATSRILDLDGAGGRVLLALPRDGRNYVIHADQPGRWGVAAPWVQPAPAWLQGPGVTGSSLVVTDVDNDADPDLIVQSPARNVWVMLRNPSTSLAPTALDVEDKGAAPAAEGDKVRRLLVSVEVPKGLLDTGVQHLEAAIFVIDPDSPSAQAPDYLFFGRVVPTLNVGTRTATFTVYYYDDALAFDKLVRTYKKRRALNLDTTSEVFPDGETDTIRAGPGSFMSLHGTNGSERSESAYGNPPFHGGSALGSKWVLKSSPPTPTADLDLLPWE